jgi:hypothetical protein
VSFFYKFSQLAKKMKKTQNKNKNKNCDFEKKIAIF